MENSGQDIANKKFLFYIILIYVGINFSGLFVPLIENASKYAQVSREIVDNNEWLNLSIANEPYDQKPPLLFWMGAISYSIFGVSAFAFKLSVLLLSLLGIYSTFRLATLLYNKKTGYLAAFFWATSLGYFYFHSDIHTDTVLVNFVILAIWQLTAFFRFKKWHQFLVGVIAIGFGMLAKGPIGLVIPVFALGTHLLVQRKVNEIFHIRWLLAIVIVLPIISPALIGLYRQFGLEGIKFFFWTNMAGRVTGSLRSSNSDVTFYLHNLILVGIPWFVFIYSGLFLEIRKYILKLIRKEKITKNDELINIGGILLYLIILSASSQKNPHYLLSILPLVMILASKWTLAIFTELKFSRAKKIISTINTIWPILIWPLVLLFTLWFYPEKKVWYWVIFTIGTVAFLYTSIKLKGLKKQIASLLTASFILLFSLNTSILPGMLKHFSTFKACEIFNNEAEKGEVLHSYRLRYWSLFYYSKNYGSWIREEDKLKELTEQKRVWIFTDGFGLNQIKYLHPNFVIKGAFKHRNLTGQTLEFLNPKTRDKHFMDFYLIELEN